MTSHLNPTVINNNYPMEVIQIHTEIDTVCIDLLAKAINILNNPSHQMDEFEKAKRLRKAGFIMAKQADLMKEEDSAGTEDLTWDLAQKIDYYHHAYPFYKFITEDQIKHVCSKYNLVLGKVHQYKGFVPEKNLVAIEQMKIKEEDKDLDVWTVGMDQAFNMLHYVEKSDFELDDDGALADSVYGYKHDYKPAKLRICAPVSDMDMTGMKIDEGYKIKPDMPPILDPIVLQPVKGGFLIITAWGNEASDELVANPVSN